MFARDVKQTIEFLVFFEFPFGVGSRKVMIHPPACVQRQRRVARDERGGFYIGSKPARTLPSRGHRREALVCVRPSRKWAGEVGMAQLRNAPATKSLS